MLRKGWGQLIKGRQGSEKSGKQTSITCYEEYRAISFMFLPEHRTISDDILFRSRGFVRSFC